MKRNKRDDAMMVPIIALLILFAFSCAVSAFNVKRDHPRLVDIPKLRAKTAMVNAIDARAAVALKESESAIVSRYGPVMVIHQVRLYSLLYALKKNDAYAARARTFVGMMMKIPESSDDQEIRLRIQALSFFYDLCYDRIPAAERKAIAGGIVRLVGRLSQAKFLASPNFGGGHEHYANISAIIGCIALYHEEPSLASLLPSLVRNMKEGFLPFHGALAEDGGWHNGWEYARHYIFANLEFCSVWRSATGEDLFPSLRWLDRSMRWIAYGMRGDFTNWGSGDNHAREIDRIERAILFKLASEYRNAQAQHLAFTLDARKPATGPAEWIDDLLWRDDGVPAKPIDALPLTAAFNRVGAYIFREGWAGDGVCALFRCSPTYFFNHAHRDCNSFEIWYKADLAIDSGYYDAYASSHWLNYYVRSIAHNTVLIVDPKEQFRLGGRQLSNDGGQRAITSPREQPYSLADLKGDAFRIADSRILEDNADYSLAMGDATRAYASSKCARFVRYFLYLRKVAGWKRPVIVVYDQVVSAQAGLDKVWLLHSVGRPAVNGASVTFVNGGGKLVCRVVQPDDYVVSVVGGPGLEFPVGGKNYPIATGVKKDIDRYAGAWRVELRARQQRSDVRFLTVLIPTDTADSALPAVRAIPGGVRVVDWDAVWSGERLVVTRAAR